MRKQFLLICALTLSLTIFAQELAHETIVVNVEVPVRVFKGSTFIDNLTTDDFEVYEDGKLQNIEAVYLIKKTKIERKEVEEKKKFSPKVSRHFVLLFDIRTFLPRVEKAIDLFFEKVILPGDSLIVLTPVKSYNLKEKSWDIHRKKEIAKQLKSIVRADAIKGNFEYRNDLRELEGIAYSLSDLKSEISGPETKEDNLDYLLSRYETILHKMEAMRGADQQNMITFSKVLKEREGQKIGFLFYQKEFIPRPEPKVIEAYMSQFQNRQDILFKLNDLFALYHRDISIDTDLIKQAFSDSSILIHFLYITPPPRITRGIHFHEQSEDIFSVFMELAKATGGITQSSSNALWAFKKAADASENYYLLYYAPLNYQKDGKFKNIKVKVKGKSYKVTHRAGYFAN